MPSKRQEEQRERERLRSQIRDDHVARRERFASSARADQDPPTPLDDGAVKDPPASRETATIVMHTPEGRKIVHSFPAEKTLLDVRAYVDAERARAAIDAAAAVAASRGDSRGPGHVLVPSELSHATSVGRSNFVEQTMRLQAEARAMRAELPTYFVSTAPRRDFLDDEALGTTLRDAGLVPNGTLLVRSVGASAAAGAFATFDSGSDGAESSAADNEDAQSRFDELSDGEAVDLAEDESAGDAAPAPSVAPGISSREAMIRAAERRLAPPPSMVATAGGAPPPATAAPTSGSSAPPAAAAVDVARREAALVAALSRANAAGVSEPTRAAPVPSASTPVATTAPDAAPPNSATGGDPSVRDAAARAAAARSLSLPAAHAATVSSPAATGKRKESASERMARVTGRCSNAGPQGLDEGLRREKLRAMEADRAAKAAERERILRRVAEDKKDDAAKARRGQAVELSSEPPAPSSFASSSSAAPLGYVGGSGDSQLQLRLDDGTTYRDTMAASTSLAEVASLVSELRLPNTSPFVLRIPYPRREFHDPAELAAASLASAGLTPRGMLIVLPLEYKGVVRKAEATSRDPRVNRLQEDLERMRRRVDDATAGIGNGLDTDDYEALLELDRSVRAPGGLSPLTLSSVQRRVVAPGEVPQDKCVICCCEVCAGDELLTLRCSHEFHAECIQPWFVDNNMCPLCKQVVSADGMQTD